MKSHPRIRRAVKWGGLIAGVSLIAVSLGSTRWYVWWISSHGVAFHLMFGRISIMDTRNWAITPGWTVLPTRTIEIDWGFDWNAGGARSLAHLTVPLWAVIVPCLVGTGISFRLDVLARRRARPGHCTACGYDMAGLAEGVGCPECGHNSPTGVA